MKKANVIFNLICSSLVLLLPAALYLKTGTLEVSFSAYHNTSATYILLISLLLVSISYWLSENKISGILLLGVAIFNMYDQPWLHYLFAVSFFLYTTFSILKDKRFKQLAIPTIAAAFLIPFIGLFWFEVVAIISFSIHSILYSLKKLKIIKSRTINK